jgi:hypothetical protein
MNPILRPVNYLLIVFLSIGLYNCELLQEGSDPDNEEAAPTEIVIVSYGQTLFLGSSMQLSYQVNPIDRELPDLVWSSSNPEVASVSTEGLVHGLKLGETIISLTSAKENLHASFYLTVTPIPLTNLYLEDKIITTYINEPKTLKVTFEPENATDKSVVWTSSNHGVLTVEQNGALNVKKLGYVWVGVEQPGGAYASANIIPAFKGQEIAANQINVRTHEEKNYIYVYLGALNKAVTVSKIDLYFGAKGFENERFIKSINPNIILNNGQTSLAEIPLNVDEAYDATFGRFIFIHFSTEDQSYQAYVNWINEIEITKK